MMEGGERRRVGGVGARYGAAQSVDPLCLQAAARAPGANGGAGGGALHCGTPGKPQLRRVYSVVRASSRTGHIPHARKPVQELRHPGSVMSRPCLTAVCPDSQGRLPKTSSELVWAGSGSSQTRLGLCLSFQFCLLQTRHPAGAHRQLGEYLCSS